MPKSSILLRNGTVLYHNDDESISSLKSTDVLVVDNKISSIGQQLTAAPDAEIIDCTNKIVSPGFIDTHHHLWQTQLKGRHADHTLYDYLPTGNLQSYNYTPADVFWGQLGGCLEAIDAGITFVLDHMHAVVSEEHASAALAATSTSHLRSILAYSTTYRFAKWDKENLVMESEALPEWQLAQLESLARKQPYGGGRVEIGFGFDLWFLPREVVLGVFERAKAAGVKVVTTHTQKNPLLGYSSVTDLIHSYDLPKSIPHLIFSHATGFSPEEYSRLKSSSVYISSTPSTECQMGMGWPVALRPDTLGALGIDCHTNNRSSILSEARLLLQMARQETNIDLLNQKKYPKTLRGSTTKVFNLATIEGAKAVGMADRIGSIAEGKLADLVIFEATSPGMICAAEYDPVVAVLKHSDIRDIDTVIVDGKIRKRGGKLVDINVEVPGAGESDSGGKNMSWSEIARELVRSRTELEKRIELCPTDPPAALFAQILGFDPSQFVSVE